MPMRDLNKVLARLGWVAWKRPPLGVRRGDDGRHRAVTEEEYIAEHGSLPVSYGRNGDW